MTGEVPLVTVYPAGGEQPLPARDSLVISPRAETPIFPRHVWGRYDQPDPVVTFRPTEDGFDIDAHDEARVTSSSGRDRSRVWRPAPGEAIRLRLSVPGRPARDPPRPVGGPGMKLRQIAHTGERTLRLPSIGTVQVEEGKAVRLAISSAGVTVQHEDYVGACERPDGDEGEWLEAVLGGGAYVAELISSGPARVGAEPEVVVRILTFDGVERWPDGRVLGVDDTTVEDVNRFRHRRDDPAQVIEWLRQELTLDVGEPLAVLTAGWRPARRGRVPHPGRYHLR